MHNSIKTGACVLKSGLRSIAGSFLIVIFVTGAIGLSGNVQAQTYNALRECAAISQNLDDIHSCMDEYLGVLDSNLAELTEALSLSLEGAALAGLNQSQQAFVEFRRQNCLWYLEFSSPRAEAEQIAKNCLATMSQDRLSELQALLSEDGVDDNTVAGLYIMTDSDRYFQPCGTDDRYWLEAPPDLENRASQLYAALSNDFSQPIYGVFVGGIDESGSIPDGYLGIFRFSALTEASVSAESSCVGIGATTLSPFVSEESTIQEDTVSEELEEDLSDQIEPQQQLIAYFGAWLVDCIENNGERICRLSVDLEGDRSQSTVVQNADASITPSLTILRLKEQVTELQLEFPNREIDSVAKIRWKVDGLNFGDIVNSEIRVDEVSSRQIVPMSSFLSRELLPMMIESNQLFLEIVDTVDDATGDNFIATLRGLTKSLEFADEFVIDSVN